MQQPPKKRRKAWILPLIILIGLGIVFLSFRNDSEPVTNAPKQQATKKSETFSKSAHSTTDPTSIWVIVNKQHPLNPQTYLPADLRQPKVSQRVPGAEQMQMRAEAAAAIEAMFADAKTAGLALQISTAFRGYNYQKGLYDGYVAKQGQEAADEQSARPGYSEHQTGFAADVRPTSGTCYLEACFGDTPEGKWVAANAYKYGFIIRYPQGKESITGYEYEPWHIRYIGKGLSNELHNKNILTLEEFFNVSGGTTYL